MWASDVSRLAFIVKSVIGKTKKSKWISGPDIICFNTNNSDSKNLDKFQFV